MSATADDSGGLPHDYAPAISQIKELIEASGMPLTEIAEKAGVRYEPLWKFSTGRQKSYNLLEGELVYYFFTKKTFLP